MRKRGNGGKVCNWLVNSLDIPADVIEGGVRAELRGRRTLTVHGCKRILGYKPNEIRLSVGKWVLSVRGEGLACNSYLCGAVGIDGKIDSLSFEEDEAGDC